MRRLELDFHRPRPQSTRAGWVLLAVALAFAAEVGWSYIRGKEEVAAAERRIAVRLQSPVSETLMRVALRPANPEELASARETIRRLAMPWEKLFAALEFAQSERIALLSVEPDPERGTVILAGEARDYLAALSYVATLSGVKGISRVHLVRHEMKPNDPRRGVVFTVSAQWGSPR